MPSSFHLRDARRRGQLLDERGRALVVAAELGEEPVRHAFGQRVARLDGFADDVGEQLELAPVLDLEGAAGLRHAQRLHDLDGVVGVGGGAHRVLQQEVAHGHAVGIDAADAARRLGGDAARTLRAQRAADALLAVGAAVALLLHALEGRLFAVGACLLEHGVD